jgi:hypothetical protein
MLRFWIGGYGEAYGCSTNPKLAMAKPTPTTKPTQVATFDSRLGLVVCNQKFKSERSNYEIF